MKRILIVAAMIYSAAAALAQVDIPNNSRNALMDLGRSLAWGAGGRGSLHNAYIFTPVSPSESFCMVIANNNPTNSHTFNFIVATTSDQQVTSYLLSPGSTRWVTATAVTGASVAANSSYYNFFRINGASRVAISITGSTTAAGTPDTADLLIGQSTFLDTGGTSCGPTNVPAQVASALFNGTSYDVPFDCPNQAAFNLAAGTDVRLITGSATHTIRICHMDYTSDTSATVTIRQGTGTTCLTNTVALSGDYPLVTGMVQDYSSIAPLKTTVAGRDVCLHFSASSTIGGTIIYADF